MKYNEYLIKYKIVGLQIREEETRVTGVYELMKTVRNIKNNMCCGLEIYLISLRGQLIRQKPVYTQLWI